tara:strand:- start:230 stop:439 length:210 start_codon:yes stop_codon:yes gene_type:complete
MNKLIENISPLIIIGFLVALSVVGCSNAPVEPVEEPVLPEPKYEEILDEECPDEWKSYHGHCMKYQNLA